MIWKILTPDETQAFKRDRTLSWAQAQAFAFALEEANGVSWLVPFQSDSAAGPPQRGHEQGAPVCFLKPGDLAREDAWELLLRLYPGHAADVALYSARHPEIPPEVFLNVLGLRNHYKNLADWQELGAVDDSSRELARRYDFPINVLRLWNRLEEPRRRAWMELWRERNVRKNIIREIIRDFYDLNEEDRTRALNAAQAYSAGWKARSGHFPGEKLRDIVREIRYPRFEELAVRMRELKQELNLPGGVRLDIPAGMESNRLKLEMDFTTVQEFKGRVEFLTKPEASATIEKILENL